jgi:hypothetical protein
MTIRIVKFSLNPGNGFGATARTGCYAWALIPKHLLLRTDDVPMTATMRRLFYRVKAFTAVSPSHEQFIFQFTSPREVRLI